MRWASRYSAASGTTLVIRETRARPVARAPREVALRILEHRYGPVAAGHATPDTLLDYQRDAVARARAILARRGGVLIADSVGLGKTHIALALVQPCLEAGGRVLIVGPAALRHHWRIATQELRGIDWLSYARLSRGTAEPLDYDHVLFDEAHALRNPATRRYRAAAVLCRGARVILLTATPVNNGIWDLYHLLRLFSRDGDYADAGVASLRSAFEEAEPSTLLGTAPALQPVLRAIMIRRTRPFLRERLRTGDAHRLVFPKQSAPVAVPYEMATASSSVSLIALGRMLLDLEFPAHEGSQAQWRAPFALLRMGLLKRLESSAHALRCSMRAYDALLRRCLDGLSRGVLIRARDESLHAASDDQLQLDALLFAELPSSFPLEEHRARLELERGIVHRIDGALDRVARSDGKLGALTTLLNGELRGRKVVLFTQFRDTAHYLHAQLCRGLRTGLVSGASARLGAGAADRRAVILRFAPRANGAPPPLAHEAVDLLIATDVLSEGFNLQDADVVISYDLPWNPVRLVQRIGRIDRLGSPHASIASYHFLPGDLERYLGLLERIARKSSAIDASVGSDMPALHAELLRALGRGAPAALENVERQDADWFEIDERLLAAREGHGPGPPLPPGFLPVALVAASEAPGPSGLVAAIVAGRFEWIAVRSGVAVQDDRVCAHLLEAALSSSAGAGRAVPAVSELEQLLAVARPMLARRAATTATGALLPSGGAGARLGRSLLALAASVPGGPDGSTCARIERCLERLASLPAGAHAGIAEWKTPDGSPASRLDQLLGRIERIDSQPSRRPGATEPRAPAGRFDRREQGRVDVVGVLLESPSER